MKVNWSRGTGFSWRLHRWLYAQVGLWKWRSTCHFVNNSACYVLKIELSLSMLSKFERKVDLKDSDFWWVACFAQKHKIVGQNRETDTDHDEDCVEEEFQLARVRCDRDGKGGREVLGMEIVVSIFEIDQSWKSSSYFEKNFPIFFLSGTSITSNFKLRVVLHSVNF